MFFNKGGFITIVTSWRYLQAVIGNAVADNSWFFWKQLQEPRGFALFPMINGHTVLKHEAFWCENIVYYNYACWVGVQVVAKGWKMIA